MAFWGFTYNIPMIMNNFLYVILFLILVIGIAVGVFAASHMKAAEKDMPVDETYQAQLKERQDRKAAKKALKAKK
ncbi:MAG: hypothetical protein FWC48_02435 [Actinomycetia bacterium]|nr:hypothetical protein [Actinomycetes bacterium]